MAVRYQKNLYNPSYLQMMLRDTDNKKHLLVREMSELKNISYERGSRESDYFIRKLLHDVRETIQQYHDMIKYFTIGMNGDVRVLEDIKFFFEKYYLDSSILLSCINLVKTEIIQHENINNDKKPAPLRASHKRKRNTFLVPLKKRLYQIESHIHYFIDPLLRDFLNNINTILFFLNIKKILEETNRSTDRLEVDSRILKLKTHISNFLWLYKKIYPESFYTINTTTFMMDTLGSMGFIHPLTSQNININQLHDIVEDATISFNIKSTPVKPGESPDVKKELKEAGDNYMLYITKFIELLEWFNYNSILSPGQVKPSKCPMKVLMQKRFLFHIPGSFKISLKVVSDYYINSLISIISWLQREFKKEKSYISNSSKWKPMIDSLKLAENFIYVYEEAIIESSKPQNQLECVLTGVVRHYISLQHARHLANLIHMSNDAIYDALSITSIMLNKQTFRGSSSLRRRIHIVRDSFDNATQRIREGMYCIKL